MCNQYNRRARRHSGGVCVCHVTSPATSIENPRMSKLRQRQRNTRAKADHVTDCVPPCPHISRAGIHTVCAWSDWEWSMQSRLSRGQTARIVSGFHCVCFAPGENSLWGGSFHQHSSMYLPHFRRGGVVAVLTDIIYILWLCSWESQTQMDQMEGMKTGESRDKSDARHYAPKAQFWLIKVSFVRLI